MRTEISTACLMQNYITGLQVRGFGWSRSRIFSPTPDVQLDKFLYHTSKMGIPVETVKFLMKLLLKQRFLAVHHNFH